MAEPSSELAALLGRLRRNASAPASAEELAALEAAASDDLQVKKLLTMRYYRTGQTAKALAFMKDINEAEPTPENIKNLMAALRAAGRLDDAIELALTNRSVLGPQSFHDALCRAYGLAGAFEKAAEHGAEALKIKDAHIPAAAAPDIKRNAYDPDKPTQNIIAFSLFRDNAQDFQGAAYNAIAARYIYTGWICRFYIDENLSADKRRALQAEGAQLRQVGGLPAETFGRFWRFLIEDDEDVALYVVRDVESVVNVRERAAVEDWLQSGKAFHIMRDHPAHCDLMLAGLWGAHRGNLPKMTERIIGYVKTHGAAAQRLDADQDFLAREVWPLARHSALIHDSWFKLEGTQPFRDEFTLAKGQHVGLNDWAYRAAEAQAAKAAG